MNPVSYHNIFTVEISHTYFMDGVCPCLKVVPGVATEKLLKRFGFGLSQNINGVGFYTSTTQPLGEYLAYITRATGEKSFDFDLVVSDALFYAYTDFPMNWQGQFLFDTANVSQGNLRIELMNNVSSPAGVLKVRFEDVAEGSENMFFSITFAARATQWQYYIINRSLLPLNNPGITGKPGVAFEGPLQVTIPTGEQALLFSSGDKLLPLSERPRHKFDLVNNALTGIQAQPGKQPSAKTIFKGLPIPDPGYLNVNSINGTSCAASPMYIYI